MTLLMLRKMFPGRLVGYEGGLGRFKLTFYIFFWDFFFEVQSYTPTFFSNDQFRIKIRSLKKILYGTQKFFFIDIINE